MKRPLTARENKVYEYCLRFLADNVDELPTDSGIATEFDKSLLWAKQTMSEIRRKGWLDWKVEHYRKVINM